ncbi:cystatin-like protein isoform X1 [Tachysurus ichikawai]
MDGALKVVLLAALILLVSAETPDTTKFPKELQVHIDNALKNVRDTYKDHHVAFHSLKGDPRLMNSIYNVNLQLTVKCKKNPHNTGECVPQKLLYLIDCLLCKTKDDEELLDCAKWIDVKNECRPKPFMLNTRADLHSRYGKSQREPVSPFTTISKDGTCLYQEEA